MRIEISAPVDGNGNSRFMSVTTEELASAMRSLPMLEVTAMEFRRLATEMGKPLNDEDALIVESGEDYA